MPITVSPVGSNLGEKLTGAVLSYTVSALPNTVTSIVEKLNGVILNTYSNPASLNRSFVVGSTTWDGLNYFVAQTIQIVVTDSTGATQTQTYTLYKGLASDGSLLEGTKAVKDAKDRISTKRDAIATQVGLSAGSTFDAISALLASNTSLRKVAQGVVTTDANNIATVASLAFKPSLVYVYREGTTNYTGIALLTSLTNSNLSMQTDAGGNMSTYASAALNNNGFVLRTYLPNQQFSYIAIS